jgi:hypothetical protein
MSIETKICGKHGSQWYRYPDEYLPEGEEMYLISHQDQKMRVDVGPIRLGKHRENYGVYFGLITIVQVENEKRENVVFFSGMSPLYSAELIMRDMLLGVDDSSTREKTNQQFAHLLEAALFPIASKTFRKRTIKGLSVVPGDYKGSLDLEKF